ncbi:hypothetical protein J7S20_00670 [Sphingomonadaceae bacterium LXI357]|uniref:DUF4129 domain-containing protein n=1 Tax=Stakelama marina TaxID=2826939 RepID=A0A8T4I9J3_9SPHN|nr:hypothetical protein [Stakelama marina]
MAGASAGKPGFPDPDAAAEAHRRLLTDSSIQFDLPHKEIERHPPPEWLLAAIRAIKHAAEWVGPAWPWILGGLALLLVAVLILTFFPSARDWLRETFGRGRPAEETEQWVPEVAVARQLLEEADALATQGRYDEAAHLLLFRSIEDIERWRGDIVRPSLTSRDIASAEALPDEARGVFSGIVAAVERSLFAGRPLSQSDWQDARGDYASFALGRA